MTTTQERDHRDPELDALMARLAAGRLMRANAPADPHFCCADCHGPPRLGRSGDVREVLRVLNAPAAGEVRYAVNAAREARHNRERRQG